MQTVIRTLGTLRRFVETFGPYLLLELLLPGGTLFAVSVFLYQRRKSYVGNEALRTAMGVMRGLMSTSRPAVDFRFPERLLAKMPMRPEIDMKNRSPATWMTRAPKCVTAPAGGTAT